MKISLWIFFQKEYLVIVVKWKFWIQSVLWTKIIVCCFSVWGCEPVCGGARRRWRCSPSPAHWGPHRYVNNITLYLNHNTRSSTLVRWLPMRIQDIREKEDKRSRTLKRYNFKTFNLKPRCICFSVLRISKHAILRCIEKFCKVLSLLRSNCIFFYHNDNYLKHCFSITYD